MPQSRPKKPDHWSETPPRLEYDDSFVTIWVESLSRRDIEYLLSFKDLDRIQINGEYVNLKPQSIKLLNDAYFSQRKEVALRFYNFSQNPSVLSCLTEVERFTFEDSYQEPIKDLSFLSSLSQLVELELSLKKINEIDVIQKYHRLKKLSLMSKKPSNVSLDTLRYFPLQELGLSNMKNIRSLPPLDSLKDLNISTICLDKENIEPLSKLKNLESLFYYYWGKNADLTTLPSLKKLKKLYLKHMLLSDFEFISDMKSLEKLTLFHLPNLNRLPSLKRLKKLKEITFVDDFKNLNNIFSLTEAKNLERLTLPSLKGYPLENYKNIFERLPKLKEANNYFIRKKDNEKFLAILKELHLKTKYSFDE